ncbi:PREDICTED: voltage-dependent calcium channel gamma-2 subunit-like, partial [Buceros rhinoceros silvestris]|uniref:voltage-dependent calcium channel gamma-2 subunit-like n=1 Tax=Buceros rhinoceros silvestris TaxID=175836 RepID=UPI000528A4E4
QGVHRGHRGQCRGYSSEAGFGVLICSFFSCSLGNFKGLCKQIDHFPEDADYEADTAEYFLRAVRASSIFPILSVILLFMGGLCIAASEFYKTRHNIILSAGIFFVSAGKGIARSRYQRRSRSSSRSTEPSHSRDASPVGIKGFNTLPSTEISMYTLTRDPLKATTTPTATYNSDRDNSSLQVHNCIQKENKDSIHTNT